MKLLGKRDAAPVVDMKGQQSNGTSYLDASVPEYDGPHIAKSIFARLEAKDHEQKPRPLKSWRKTNSVDTSALKRWRMGWNLPVRYLAPEFGSSNEMHWH